MITTCSKYLLHSCMANSFTADLALVFVMPVDLTSIRHVSITELKPKVYGILYKMSSCL